MKGNDLSKAEDKQEKEQHEDERGQEGQSQSQGPLVRRVVRNLEVATCDGGVAGHQYIVECKRLEETKCQDELEQHGVVIINDLPESDFFVVCVDTPEEKQKLMELATVKLHA